MGYYTSYELKVRRENPSTENEEARLAKLKEQMIQAESAEEMQELALSVKTIGDDEIIAQFRTENGHAEYAFDDDGSTSGRESKWYSHEEALRDFSKNYPDHLFTLSGEGEEAGDLWVKYFMDGRMQYCKAKISFNPFDVNKLK